MIKINEENSKLLKFQHARKTQLAEAVKMKEEFSVETMEGTMTGKPGDYLMRGIKGEVYPCDGEVFENSYEFI